MAHRTVRAAAVAAAMALGALTLSTGTANALVAPPGGGGGASKCTTISAGYEPVNVGTGASYVWSGNLQFYACVSKTSTGLHYASAKLSSPQDYNVNDRFTGLLTIYLQGCTAKTPANLTSADHAVSQYETGVAAGGRYQFATTFTPSSSAAYSTYGYRVRIHTASAAVVPHILAGKIYYLAPGTTVNGQTDYYSPCYKP